MIQHSHKTKMLAREMKRSKTLIIFIITQQLALLIFHYDSKSVYNLLLKDTYCN